MITPSGYAEITRKVGGKWLDVIPWRQDTNIKRDAGSTNVLDVETRGDGITVMINGAKFATVKGQVPTGGGPNRHARPIREGPGRHLEVQRAEGHRPAARQRCGGFDRHRAGGACGDDARPISHSGIISGLAPKWPQTHRIRGAASCLNLVIVQAFASAACGFGAWVAVA